MRSLELDGELTLEKAKKKIRQQEVVGEQQQQLNVSATQNPRADVELNRSRVPRPFTSSLPVERQGTRRGTPPRQTCIRCGSHSHPREPCPAKDVTCHRCQKRGHYSSKRLTKVQISELTQDSDLCRFFGMANQLGKFSQNLPLFTKPLRELLSKNCTWMWGSRQTEAFTKVREALHNQRSWKDSSWRPIEYSMSNALC